MAKREARISDATFGAACDGLQAQILHELLLHRFGSSSDTDIEWALRTHMPGLLNELPCPGSTGKSEFLAQALMKAQARGLRWTRLVVESPMTGMARHRLARAWAGYVLLEALRDGQAQARRNGATWPAALASLIARRRLAMSADPSSDGLRLVQNTQLTHGSDQEAILAAIALMQAWCLREPIMELAAALCMGSRAEVDWLDRLSAENPEPQGTALAEDIEVLHVLSTSSPSALPNRPIDLKPAGTGGREIPVESMTRTALSATGGGPVITVAVVAVLAVLDFFVGFSSWLGLQLRVNAGSPLVIGAGVGIGALGCLCMHVMQRGSPARQLVATIVCGSAGALLVVEVACILDGLVRGSWDHHENRTLYVGFSRVPLVVWGTLLAGVISALTQGAAIRPKLAHKYE
jgi:hypothetical protein